MIMAEEIDTKESNTEENKKESNIEENKKFKEKGEKFSESYFQPKIAKISGMESDTKKALLISIFISILPLFLLYFYSQFIFMGVSLKENIFDELSTDLVNALFSSIKFSFNGGSKKNLDSA